MASYREIMELVGNAVDATGVAVIIIGALAVTARFLSQFFGARPAADAYRTYRQGLGRAILLGLEFLVAGDIIRTVVVAPTRENVVILALIVLIRTFLSMALQLEIDGRWPWQTPALPSPAPLVPPAQVPAPSPPPRV
jgi:uncharacterized membrane protein